MCSLRGREITFLTLLGTPVVLFCFCYSGVSLLKQNMDSYHEGVAGES